MTSELGTLIILFAALAAAGAALVWALRTRGLLVAARAAADRGADAAAALDAAPLDYVVLGDDARPAVCSAGLAEALGLDAAQAADPDAVAGAFDGEISAKEVHLTRNARVTGDIWHESISVEPGASIEGRLGRPKKAKAPKSEAPAAEAPPAEEPKPETNP